MPHNTGTSIFSQQPGSGPPSTTQPPATTVAATATTVGASATTTTLTSTSSVQLQPQYVQASTSSVQSVTSQQGDSATWQDVSVIDAEKKLKGDLLNIAA